jgi:alpha-D-ribose 1-methylphosphonate 5-triphosphate synthase subunit PhnL
MASPSQPILQVSGLSKSFRLHHQGGTEIPALDRFELVVHPGECVALIGPSGSGKSTLLRCLYGNYIAGGGQAYVRDGDRLIDIFQAHPRTLIDLRRRVIGYVSQFLRVIPRVSALDVVAEPLLIAGAEPAAARARAAELLDRLALPERLWGLAPQTFSGGEQQRVNIARGLARDYPLLLVDEPTSALDAENRERAASLFEEAKARGAAIIGAFHDADTVAALATRKLIMTTPQREAA